MTQSRRLIAVDFDRTLHSHSSGWQGARVIPDPPVRGAMLWLATTLEHFDVAIHSCRSRRWGGRRAMRAWLRLRLAGFRVARGDDWQEATRWSGSMVARIQWPLLKPDADVFVDDRAIGFRGDWSALTLTPEALRTFEPWNRT